MVRNKALAATTLLLVAVAACSGGDDDTDGDNPEPAAASQPLTVEVVSSRPEYVSGGDALVAVTLADGEIEVEDVRVEVDDRTVAKDVQLDPDDPQRALVLVEGLDEGESDVVASAVGESATMTVTNHPASGPMFSGEQLPLVACSTESFGLAPSTPEQGCDAPTEVTWSYVDAAGERKDLADPAAVPADAEMVDVEGQQVPFVIRTEQGVLNRSVYTISVLDPSPDTADPLATVDTSAWNDRLVYRFGGGCGASFTQGFSWAGGGSLEVLRRGYATATATFNTFQVLCNDVISAETVSMVKEHFVEAYGQPDFTIGEGGSGGAIQQLLIAQNYPGLLDGIAPSLPFPDALSIGGGVFDCALLANYYATPEGSTLTPEQQTAINGHAVPSTCGLWDASFANNIDPAGGCRFNVGAIFAGDSAAPLPTLGDDDIYDPVSNPDGLRCTVWETNVAVTGRDPETGFANSGYDNEGIQYGLDALNAGTITVDQFLDLNEHVGGFDIDGQGQPERSVVADELVARAYETGRVTGPWGGLPDTPIILVNLYTDEVGDIHDRVRAFSVLDRLAGEEGGEPPASVSLWSLGIADGSSLIDNLSGAIGDTAAEPTFVLDEWLTAAAELEADNGGSRPDALAETKPESAESRCTLDGGEPVVGPDANTEGPCAEAFAVHEEPRMAAGAPRPGNLLKCQLVAVEDASDLYEVELSDTQLDRLAAIFPDGVCDYSKPSVGYAEPSGTWLDLDEID